MPLSSSPESNATGKPDLPPPSLKSTTDDVDPTTFLKVLGDALCQGNYSPDAILGAVADAARILTAAESTAVALKVEDGIVCRARTGDIAPQLGARLNVDSGISGECFRTCRSLYCADTESDSRVDAEVCRVLGIRSIAAIPLRAHAGTFGMIEALSSRAYAFSDNQIHALARLGEIAEDACEQKALATAEPAIPTDPDSDRTKVSADSIFERSTPSNKRRFWILGAVAAIVLLASAVVWWTWREPSGDPDNGEARVSNDLGAKAASSQTAASTPPARPSPIVGATRPDESQHGIVKNAAKIEVDDTPPTVSSHATPADASLEAVRRRSSRPPGTGAYAIEPPPTVVTSPSDNGDKLANVTASTAPLPELDVKISQGVKESTIDRRIEPTYPAEALRRKVQGAVTVEVSIAENGTVSNVKILRGEPLLATAAADAIRKWRYTPTLLDGKPTAVQKEITINFKLP